MSELAAHSGLPEAVIQKIRQVFAHYPAIDQVLLYGSRAKGNFRKGSDIDLTIKADPIDLSQLMQIENDLDELLLPYKIDLSLFAAIESPELVDHIQRVGILFYSR